MAYDRAAILAPVLVRIFLDYLIESWNDTFNGAELCERIATRLREEFADAENRAASDRPHAD
jgi:hypothetical protein